MRNIFSTAVIVAVLALLVPNNGAQAVNAGAALPAQPAGYAQPATDGLQPVAAAQRFDRVDLPGPSLSSTAHGPDPAIAWMLALGFLGLVVLRRTGAPPP